MPKFENVFCSQCGGSFGPRDSGYSHCEDHRADRITTQRVEEVLELAAEGEGTMVISKTDMLQICGHALAAMRAGI